MIIHKGYFSFGNIPRFPCPRCGRGQLRIVKDTLIKKLPAWIRALPDGPQHDEHGHEILNQCSIFENSREEFIASFFLQCDIEFCEEVVVLSGLLKWEIEYDDSDPSDIQQYDVECFHPTSFYPTVHLFKVPEKTPEKVKNELINSFSLFWISAPACGNAIRVAVERLMDEKNIPVTKCSAKGKEIALTLHERIEKFGEDFKELSDLLFAIKWIGNDASHTSDLYHSDVVLAYELFERCLVELFEESKIERLKILANEINTQKKPISKVREVRRQQITEGQ